MNSRLVLVAAGLLALFAPGCCLLHHGCGSSCGSSCGCDSGCGCGLLGCLSKIRHKIHSCSLCKSHSCMGDCGCSCGDGGMMGMPVGDCGCGGGMPVAGCGCAVPGQGGSPYMTTPPMMVPSVAPAPPVPQSNMMPPPIPSTDSSSLQPVPQATQQVSMEEFQRLPGVVISGPGSPQATAASPQLPAQPNLSTLPTQTALSQPVQQPAGLTVAPANAKQIQQTGWAPVRQ